MRNAPGVEPADNGADACGACGDAACHGTGEGASQTGLAPVDFFTGGGQYMPRTHCMVNAEGGTDWFWVIFSIATMAVIVGGYFKIFTFWRKAYLAEQPSDRNDKLMDLAWIFLLCAICGYLSSIVMFFWPGYRLLAFMLVPLAFFTWRFARDLSGFRLALQAKRLERELRESLEARNTELERLVAERTAELERARADAERANRAKSGFLANMSHEIRTPMNAILGFAGLVAAPDCTEDERAEHTTIIERNGHHLLALIDDVLDLSKIEAGEIRLERLSCDPARLAREAIELLRPRAAERGNTIALDIADDVPERIEADATRLKQILVNLVGNAVKFTESGTIGVHVEAEASHVHFCVTDTGIGVAEDQLSRIFQPFSQADESTTRRHGGTGLGLSISRQLAEAMGGGISATSTPGVGSTFTASVLVGAPDDLPDAHATSGVEGDARELPSCRVLLAEDAPDNQRLIVHYLQRAGAEVSIAGNGQEALDAVDAQTQPFDLILMDMQMPKLSGAEATRRLRDRGVATPIIALTACNMPSERAVFFDAGCSAYLSKPVNQATLIDACRAMLDRPRRGAA